MVPGRGVAADADRRRVLGRGAGRPPIVGRRTGLRSGHAAVDTTRRAFDRDDSTTWAFPDAGRVVDGDHRARGLDAGDLQRSARGDLGDDSTDRPGWLHV
jgi:hypothetical protein